MDACPELSPDELMEVAVEAAMDAGEYALENYSRRDEVHSRLDHDVKLKLDLECQERVEEVVRSRYPDHSLLGEEDASLERDGSGSSEWEWIIDPIDGTVNFSHGYPGWCCSVAVRRGQEVVAGAVYAPVISELYVASTTSPPQLNGDELRISEVGTLDASLVMTGLDHLHDYGLKRLALFERMADRAQRMRVVGCAALDLCQVAAGRAEAYFEAGIYLWDIAAAGLILRRAGGRTETLLELNASHRFAYLATNGLVHDELREILSIPDGAQ